MKPQVLFSVNEFDGLHSAKHPLAMGPGMAYDLKNCRKRPGGPISVRNGIADVSNITGLPSGTFKGCSELYNDGTYHHFLMAWKEADNDVHVYWLKYTNSSATWDTSYTQVTADSGKFGDTALTDPANGYVQFYWTEAPSDDQTLESFGGGRLKFRDAPLCVISDGTKAVIFDVDTNLNGPELGSDTRGVSHSLAIPAPKGNLGVVFDAYDWLDMAAAATQTGSGTGDWGTVNDTNSTWVFTTGAGSGTPAVLTGNDTAHILFDSEEITFAAYTGVQDYFQARQFWMVATTTKDDFWENCDFAFSWKEDGGSYGFTYFDAPPLVLDTNVTGYKFVVFELPDLLPGNANSLLMNGLQLRTRVTTPVSNTLTIYSMSAGGVVPGGTEYGIARRNRVGHVYSPGVTCHHTGFDVKRAGTRGVNDGILDGTVRADFNGAPSNSIRAHSRALPNDFILPVDSRVYYAPDVYYSSPTQDELDTYAADYVAIYRKEPGESDYYQVERIAVANYASGWNFESGFAASSSEVYTDVVRAQFREYSDRLPDESCIPPMPFMAGASFGGRSYLLENTKYGTLLRISEQGNPMRFTEGVAVSDDTKGGFNIKISKAKGRAIGQAEYLGGNSASAQVVVLTDEDAWAPFRMQGDVVLFDLRRVSSYGSVGPAIATVEGTLAWLDKDREVRVLGDSKSLSRDKVSDILDAIPDAYVSIADMAYWRGRLYIAYCPSGQTENQRVLVYNVNGGYWEGYDTLPADKEVQRFIHFRHNANKLYYIDSLGFIREYEKASTVTDDGAAISFLIESGEYHNDYFQPVVAHRMGTVCDDASVTLNTTRTTLEPSATFTGTILLSTGTDRAWKYDDSGSGARVPGCESVGVRFKFDGDFSEAHSFYSFVAEVKGGQFGGATG